MTKLYKLFLFLFLCNTNFLFSATYTSANSGNWNVVSTWSPSGVPIAGDVVIIGNHIITVTADAACASITTRSGIGESRLIVNTGVNLILNGVFLVEATNANDNNTFLSGNGRLQVLDLVIGSTTLNNSFPTTTRLTTLFVVDLAELKITRNIISTTPVNVTPIAFNESRLIHLSGVIDLTGILSIQNNRSGPVSLGYRTDNINQGDSKIIFRNVNPTIPIDVQKAPNFSGGTVEFLSAATTISYPIPSLVYKHLILNSNRPFTSGGSTTSIGIDGIFNLKLGVFSSSSNNQMRINDGVTIVRSAGSFASGTNSRMRLTNATNQYNVTYEQHTSVIPINDFPAYFPGSTLLNSLKTVQINSTNGVNLDTNTILVENLIINANCTISGSGHVNVTDVFNIPNGSTVNVPDNFIKLVSTSDNTARVAALPAGTVINGKVSVERFLPNIQRNWRLLTAPVKGNSVNSVWENWQDNGVFDITDSGADFWGPTGSLIAADNGSTLIVTSTGNGLSLINNSSYNLRAFDNVVGTWSNVTNTLSQPLFTASINQGFLSFITHPFLGATDLSGVGYTGSVQTILNASGLLITGDVTYPNIASNKFYLIGNPYASPIDFQSILAEPGNTGVEKVWVIDPSIGIGSYVTWDAIAGYSNVGTIFSGNTIFQSGQAFFVKASSATTTLTIKESHKSDFVSNSTLYKSTANQNSTSTDLFRILLEKDLAGTYTNMDGCVAAFYQGGSNAVDGKDGSKLSNPTENLSLFNANFSLSIEHRAPIQDNDFLTLRLSQAIVGVNYKLRLFTENFTYSGNAFLQDIFTGTTTQLPTDGSVFQYPFQVTSNVLSVGNRFKIVFQPAILNNAALNVKNFSIYPNPVKNHESITVLFHSTDNADAYEYKIYNSLGQLMQFDTLSKQSNTATIMLTNKLTTGLYFIQLHNLSNDNQFTQSLIIN
jgi:hypothetical protein